LDAALIQPAQAGFVSGAKGFSPASAAHYLLDQYRIRKLDKASDGSLRLTVGLWA